MNQLGWLAYSWVQRKSLDVPLLFLRMAAVEVGRITIVRKIVWLV